MIKILDEIYYESNNRTKRGNLCFRDGGESGGGAARIALERCSI